MATIAESYSVKRGAAKAPISAHPAFPAIVALWFAALLGLGSLVLPIALLERFVTMTGIVSLIPSAAPPLGFTAHAVIALVGAIAGAALGLALARKVAQSQAPEPKAWRGFDEARRRPISAHEDLDEEGIASAESAAPLPGQKRRSLAMAEDNLRSTYLDAAPLPGLAGPLDVAPLAEPDEHQSAAIGAIEESEPLELTSYADLGDDEAEAAPDTVLEALRSRIHDPVEPTSIEDDPMTERQTFDPSSQLGGDRQDFARSETADEYAGEPLHFAAPSLRREAAFDEDEIEEPGVEAFNQTANPLLSVVADAPAEIDEEEVDVDRPLEELGLVQLAARLGASLHKRRARQSSQPSAVPPQELAAFVDANEFEEVRAEDAARAIADFFAPARASEAVGTVDEVEPERPPEVAAAPMPGPLRSVAPEWDDDAEGEALAASFTLPLGGRPQLASDAVIQDVESDEGDDEDDDGEYSSLLEMKNPFARQQEFVRVEEPEQAADAIEPTVTFPPSPVDNDRPAAPDTPLRLFDPPKNAANSAAPATPRDPGDAERNLRAALATLQRMSGAA